MVKAEEAAETEAQQAPGGKKKLIFIIVGALLLVGLSVGATVMLVGGGGDENAEAAVEEEPKPAKGDPTFIELKPFTVNLDPQDPVGFLQIQIQILTYFSEVAEELDTHKPLIRNNLTLLFGQQKSEDLRTPQGKAELQARVLESIQQVITQYGSGGEVDNVFFTNFVMQ